MQRPINERPAASVAVVLWIAVMLCLAGLVVVMMGCAQGPQQAPLSRLAGANPNCVRNCSASFLAIENNRPGDGPFNPVVTGSRTFTESETTSR